MSYQKYQLTSSTLAINLSVIVLISIIIIQHASGFSKERLFAGDQLESSGRVRRDGAPILGAVDPSHKCPNPNKQRYYKVDGKCHKVGSKGPCGESMLFYAYNNSTYGDCDCNHLSKIPLVFNLNTSLCYPIYQQGFCPDNHWLVYDTDNNTICEERKCPLSKKTIVHYKEKCVELEANDKTCEARGERVRFPPGEFQPRCADDNTGYNIGAGLALKCSPGYRIDLTGNCRQKVKFNSNGADDFLFLTSLFQNATGPDAITVTDSADTTTAAVLTEMQ